MGLKEQIRALGLDAGLSAEERTRRIQALYSAQRERVEAPPKAVEGRQCAHYARQCSIVAKCCGLVVGCRLCHDEALEHKIDRHATEEMVCRLCGQRQPVAECCRAEDCAWKSTRYFCAVCRLWEDTEGKDIFHCDKCKLCRLGKRENFRHCDKCSLCMPPRLFATHTCVNTNNDCPVCGEDLQSSTNSVIPLRCGHALHATCFSRAEALGHSSCPMCRKSFTAPDEVFAAVTESILARNEMPAEFRGIVAVITCNDCNRTSEAPFHFMGHRCGHCSSFNTIVLSRHGPPELPCADSAETDLDPNETDDGGGAPGQAPAPAPPARGPGVGDE